MAFGAAITVSSAEVKVSDRGPWFGGPLDVDGLAVEAVAAALVAAAELAEARGLGRPAASLSAEHVAVSFTSGRGGVRSAVADGAVS